MGNSLTWPFQIEINSKDTLTTDVITADGAGSSRHQARAILGGGAKV